MNTQFWDNTAMSAMFTAPSQNGPFPVNVSSYFRRPSKVVKSSSRNNSPRNTGRRRMTTTGHFPARTRSVVDYERASMPQLSQYQSPSNRPISWHPNTMQDMSYLQVPPQYSNESMMPSPYTTVEMNGLVTPVSFPIMDEPQIQELISPLEGLSAGDAANAYGQGQDFSMETWLNQHQMKTSAHFHASMYPDMLQSDWDQVNAYNIPPIHNPTAPASPNYLPMPDFGASLADQVQEPELDKDELVGMGLYDSPAQVQSSSLLFGNGLGSFARKTLKLEDAFEPTQSDEDDDEEDDAPGEPDDEIFPASGSIRVNPVVTNLDGISSSSIIYPTQDESDFAAMQQWQVSQGGNTTWI